MLYTGVYSLLEKHDHFLLLCGNNICFRALVLNPDVVLKKEKSCPHDALDFTPVVTDSLFKKTAIKVKNIFKKIKMKCDTILSLLHP